MAPVSTLDAVAERVARGEPLRAPDAGAILATPDLVAVGMLADEVRQGMHGAATTFCRVFELHAEAVPDALPPGLAAGEIRLVASAPSLDAACRAVAAARRLAGDVVLAGFSLADPIMAEADAFPKLAAAGLDAIAEVPVDQTPSAAARVRAARAAGLLVTRITVQDPPADAVAVITAAAALQREAGGFHALAPLPRTIDAGMPTTGYDDVKLVAMARLVARDVPSIQVDWALYGPKLAQVALTVGADDVDGVAAVESGALGPRRSALEEILRNIRAAGLTPVERNGRYERLE